MSEFKGTPGPWLNAGRSAGSHIHADKGEVAWLRSYIGIDDDKEIEANARLIAAAPELLEALIAAKKVCDVAAQMTGCRSDDDFVWGAQKKIDAAIAKALGEQK